MDGKERYECLNRELEAILHRPEPTKYCDGTPVIKGEYSPSLDSVKFGEAMFKGLNGDINAEERKELGIYSPSLSGIDGYKVEGEKLTDKIELIEYIVESKIKLGNIRKSNKIELIHKLNGTEYVNLLNEVVICKRLLKSRNIK